MFLIKYFIAIKCKAEYLLDDVSFRKLMVIVLCIEKMLILQNL